MGTMCPGRAANQPNTCPHLSWEGIWRGLAHGSIGGQPRAARSPNGESAQSHFKVTLGTLGPYMTPSPPSTPGHPRGCRGMLGAPKKAGMCTHGCRHTVFWVVLGPYCPCQDPKVAPKGLSTMDSKANCDPKANCEAWLKSG